MPKPFAYQAIPQPVYTYPQSYPYAAQQSTPYAAQQSTPFSATAAASAAGLVSAWASFMPILLILIAVAIVLATLIYGPVIMGSKPKAEVMSMGIQSGIVLGLFTIIYNVIGSTAAITEVEQSYAHMMLVLVTGLLLWNYLSNQLSVTQKPTDGLDSKSLKSSSSRSSSSSSSSRPSGSSSSSSARDPTRSSSSRSSSSTSKPSSSSSSAPLSSSSLKAPPASSSSSAAKSSSSSRSASSSSSFTSKPNDVPANPDPWNKAHPSAYLTTPKAPSRIWPFPIGYAKSKAPDSTLWWASGIPAEAGTIDIDGNGKSGEGAASSDSAVEVKSRTDRTTMTATGPGGKATSTTVEKSSSSTTPPSPSGPDLNRYLKKIDERLAKANLSPEETAKMRKKMLAKVTGSARPEGPPSKPLPPGLGPPRVDELSEFLPPLAGSPSAGPPKVLRWQDEEGSEPDDQQTTPQPRALPDLASGSQLGSPVNGSSLQQALAENAVASAGTPKSTETPEQRAARKAAQAAAPPSVNGKRTESPEERAARKALENGSLRSSGSKSAETPEQRAARKAAEGLGVKQTSSRETAASRTLLDSSGTPVASSSTRATSSSSRSAPLDAPGAPGGGAAQSDEGIELLKKKRLVKHIKMLVCVTTVAILNYQVGFLCFVGLVLFLIDDLTSPIIASDMLRSDPATDAEIASSTTTRSSSSSSRPSASTASSSSSSRSASSSSSRVLTDKEKAALPTSAKPKGEEPSSETLPVMSMMYMSTPSPKMPGMWKSPEHLVQVHGPNNPLLGSFH